jgi:hypothetical protein
MGPAVCAAGIRRWEFFIKSSLKSYQNLKPYDFEQFSADLSALSEAVETLEKDSKIPKRKA